MADDATEVAAVTTSFLAERDDGERVLERLLAVDSERETWTFDDVPLDSGAFGEVVSRGIVEPVDGEYRVAEPAAVRAVLEGEEVAGSTGESADEDGFDLSNAIDVDWHALAGLLGALTVLFAMRVLNYRSVFRGEHVVSPANDPYYFRYWMEQLLAESDGATDYGVIAGFPDGIGETRPLTHASNWFLAELLGGDQWAADVVAAWLPVVATLVVGVLLYWLAVIATDDVRVGLASVVLFALTPVHAVYTGIGFLDHELHQYLWMGVTLVAFARLATDFQRRHEAESSTRAALRGHLLLPWTWLATLALGAGLAFSAHAWGGSVMMFVPAAAYVGFKAAMDAREGVSPALANAPVLVGLGIAGGLSAALHFRWGWHETFTALVPVLVFVGAVGAVVFGELWRRFEWPTGPLVALQGALAVVGLYAFRRIRPEDWARLSERFDDLMLRERYTESVSLFTLDLGIVFGPLAQIGVGFYVGVAVLAWALWVVSRRYEPAWLLLSVYVCFWLVAATIQVRFAAQLAIPLSVFGGVGLVALLAWVDLARVPVPFRDEREAVDSASADSGGVAADGGSETPSVVFPGDVRTAAYLVGIALLVCGTSLIFVPSLVAQTAYDEAQYETAMAIDGHAEAVDREYPENYVLSHWPENRMYNYFVNGEAERYGYADQHYQEFLFSPDPDEFYGQFENRVGYVVVAGGWTDGETLEPVAHYQAISLDDDASAFAVVPGATIEGEGEPDERISIETTVEVSGETLSYEREATVDENGTYAVTVPYPGEYDVDGRTVTVTEDDVLDGTVVAIEGESPPDEAESEEGG